MQIVSNIHFVHLQKRLFYSIFIVKFNYNYTWVDWLKLEKQIITWFQDTVQEKTEYIYMRMDVVWLLIPLNSYDLKKKKFKDEATIIPLSAPADMFWDWDCTIVKSFWSRSAFIWRVTIKDLSLDSKVWVTPNDPRFDFRSRGIN